MTTDSNILGTDLVGGGFSVVVGNLYTQGVTQALPWLVAMTFVVLIDLLTGLRKCWMLGEEIRWSKGMRCTISKLITYWAFAVGAVMVDVASGADIEIAKWCCLLVCAIEGMSIVGNILRPHGITISIKGIMHAIGSKVGADLDGVVKSENSKTKKK